MPRKPLSAPRWRLRFRFRSLLVVITLWGILLSWVAKEQRQSRFERRLGNDLPGLVIYCGPFDSYSRHWDHEPQGWWRDIARIVMGERVFSIRLDFGASADLRQLSRLACLEILAMEDATVRNISPLAESRTLKHLWLRGTSVSDLHPLARLKNLESVGLEETEVTDLTPLADIKTIRLLYLDSTKVKDLAPLVGLDNLETLSIFNTSVKDVSAIARLRRLKELTLDSTITEGQVGQLRQALPDCKITVRNKRSKKSIESADTVPQDGSARAGPG